METVSTIIIKIITYGVPLIVAYLVYKLYKDKKKAADFLEEENVVISINVPKNNEKTPLAAEQMFAALHGLLRPSDAHQAQLSLEIAAQNKFTQFYMRVPSRLKDYVEGQVYAQYPTVEIREVPDYTDIPLDSMAVAGTELTLKKEDVYPIKTFLNFDVDPLAGITGVMSKVDGNERVWIQMVTTPVGDSWQDRGIQLAKAAREGHKLNVNIPMEILKHIFGILLEVPKALLNPPKQDDKKKDDNKKKDDKNKLPEPQEVAVKGIEAKIQKLGFSTKIRILAISDDEEDAKAKLMAVVGVFRQFNTNNLNCFAVGNIITTPDIVQVFQLRPFGVGGSIFNIEELASLYHFPSVAVESPSIVWAGSKKGEPPANLPIQGAILEEELTTFAETNFRHYTEKFGLKRNDRRLHTYVIGKTGTGKSTLLQNMIIDDIREGRGVAVVDPHGDLIKHVLNFIPEERSEDIVYLNPADSDFPIGFNLLENVDPDLKNIVASGLMSVFTKLWANVWSARMEYILRNSILALLEYPGATFLGIMRLLTDKNYRTKVLEHVKDPVIRDFFLNEYEKYDPKFRTEAIAPIQNKVGQFLSSTTIRNIVGQEKSSINMKEVMNTGKIFLIDLSIGKIGEDNSALLGGMLITKIQLTAMERVDIPENERRDFYLYVDEFQNFATESFAVILSEARKYHLNLILANQYIAQVPEVVADAIFGNVGTMISFRIGANDATKLVKEFEPVFEANDMVNLANYHIYIKMAIDGVTCPAFSAVTLPPLTEAYGNMEKLIEFSRRTYGQPREAVEAEISRYADEEQVEVKPKEPLKIGTAIYKEISAKGAIKWFFYEQEEGEDDLEEALENSEDIITDGGPGSDGQIAPAKEEEHEHLISTEEAHSVAKEVFEHPAPHAKKNEDGPDLVAPAMGVDDAVLLREGEITDIQH